jgi:uncharacterized protein (TIRG00374 family)
MKSLKVLMTVLVWLLLAWYSVRAAQQYEIDLASLVPVIPAIGLLYLFNNAIRAEFVRTLYRISGHNVPRLHSLLTVFIASSLNFILPLKVGSAYRALYLKKHFGLDLSKFASTLFGFTVHIASACLLLTLLALLAILLVYQRWNSYLFVSLAFILLVILVLPRFTRNRLVVPHDNRFTNFLRDFSDSSHYLLNHPGLLGYALLTVIALTLTNGISLYLVLNIIDSAGEFLLLCLLALTQTLSGQLSVTPGAVGIQEAAAAMVFSLVAIPPAKILLAVFSIRVIKIFTIVVFLYPAHFLLNRLGTHRND